MTKNRLPIALQQAVMRRLRTDLAQANHILKTDYPEPQLNYQQKGTVAGTAHYQNWRINLNSILLLENGQPFIDEVVPHELAHLLAHRHFGRVSPHGKEWQYMMENVLNVPANRTHKFDIRSVQGKVFEYDCQCQRHQLTIRRHNKIQNGQTEYRCKQCHSLLKLVPNTQG